MYALITCDSNQKKQLHSITQWARLLYIINKKKNNLMMLVPMNKLLILSILRELKRALK